MRQRLHAPCQPEFERSHRVLERALHLHVRDRLCGLRGRWHRVRLDRELSQLRDVRDDLRRRLRVFAAKCGCRLRVLPDVSGRNDPLQWELRQRDLEQPAERAKLRWLRRPVQVYRLEDVPERHLRVPLRALELSQRVHGYDDRQQQLRCVHRRGRVSRMSIGDSVHREHVCLHNRRIDLVPRRVCKRELGLEQLWRMRSSLHQWHDLSERQVRLPHQ
jgi:hypothetical protein